MKVMTTVYKLKCLETCTIQGTTFFEGREYEGSFPLEGQTYYIPEGSPYPWRIGNVDIWGLDALKFEEVESWEKELYPDTLQVKINMGGMEVNRVQQLGEFSLFSQQTHAPFRDADPTPSPEEFIKALDRLEELTGKPARRPPWVANRSRGKRPRRERK